VGLSLSVIALLLFVADNAFETDRAMRSGWHNSGKMKRWGTKTVEWAQFLIKKSMRSRFRKPNQLSHIPDAPVVTTLSQKLSHSLPLIFHLLITQVILVFSLTVSVLVHLIDGPLLDSWNLTTTIVHSCMKSLMKTSAPQGRHSMDIIRFATKFKFPDWIFNGQIEHDIVEVEGSSVISDAVRRALKVTNLTHIPEQSEKRNIQGEWINNQVTEDTDTVILYLHGGSHIFLSPNTHRVITTELSKVCNAHVFALDYRLAPEYPFPFAIEDALAAYLAIVDPHAIRRSKSQFRLRTPAFKKVFIMGDSSGGCLTMQLVEVIKQMRLPCPNGVVLLSPFLDHLLESQSWHSNWNTDFMSLDHKGVEWALDCYANGVCKSHPSVSPIYADVSEYPPMLIQAGSAEVVMDDSIRYYKKGIEAGNHVELELYENMFHVFQTFPFLKESGYAFERIGKFVQSLAVDSDGSQSEDTFDGEKDSAILINQFNQSIPLSLFKK
jgi:acetyl esterase/lipase